MERLFSDKERSDPNYFPRFYFLLVPFGSQGLSSGDQWSGILNSLKGELQKRIGIMEEKIGTANKKMEEKLEEKMEEIGTANKKMEEKLEKKMEEIGTANKKMQGQIGSMEEKIASIEEKIASANKKMEQKMEERMDRIDAMQAEFLSLLREMKK
jgi:chromosome segregation ATPase